MPHCLNPTCSSPQNPPGHRFCQSCGASLVLRGRYVAERLLGQGGFGRTFLAIAQGDEPDASTPCVIKQFFPASADITTHAKASELFLQEALRLEDLGHHPQIPDFWGHFEEAGQHYLIQEYIEGETLGARLESQGVFAPDQVRSLLLTLLPILDFVHQHRVIHRDIKPDNILQRTPSTPNADPEWVLVDFGAAKVATATALARTGTVIGSAGFVAPEQLGGRAVFASDLYGLGVTCVHLLTGVDPFELYSFSEDGWVWRDFLPQPIEDGLGQILDRLIARPLKQRYAAAIDALTDLQALSTATTAHASADTTLPAAPAYVDDMPSVVGIDYTPLRDLLAIAQWDKADAETTRLMLQAMQCPPDGYLSLQELAEFPCQDLRTLNHLWQCYSNGHLGFAVQCQIWQKIAGSTQGSIAAWSQFCEELGWLTRETSRVGQRVIGEATQTHWRSRDDVWGQVHDCPLDLLQTQVPRGFLPFFSRLYTGISRGGRIFLDHVQHCDVS